MKERKESLEVAEVLGAEVISFADLLPKGRTCESMVFQGLEESVTLIRPGK